MANFKKYALQGIFTQYQRVLRKLDSDLLVFLEEVLSNLDNILNSGIKFSDNFDGETLSYTSNAIADTEDAVAHTLNRVPIGFIVVDTDKGGVVYRSGTAFTNTNIYLKCSTASTALKVLVY